MRNVRPPAMMKIVGHIQRVETIADGTGIRKLAGLRARYGDGNWKKKKGVAMIRLNDGTQALLAEPYPQNARALPDQQKGPTSPRLAGQVVVGKLARALAGSQKPSTSRCNLWVKRGCTKKGPKPLNTRRSEQKRKPVLFRYPVARWLY